jgi:signal-transduction protein with cAMP-binding, CBS, and nucleotidyltransferase domain
MVERLSALPALADIPREQLEWLVDHGEVHRFEDGATFYGGSTDLAGLYLLVSGRFSVRVDQDGVVREVREISPGGITGGRTRRVRSDPTREAQGDDAGVL